MNHDVVVCGYMYVCTYVYMYVCLEQSTSGGRGDDHDERTEDLEYITLCRQSIPLYACLLIINTLAHDMTTGYIDIYMYVYLYIYV